MFDACPQPCYQVGYEYRLDFMHNYFYIDPKGVYLDEAFHLWILWESLLVVEEVEALVYDEINFAAAAGGYLGLFLGFSCFGLLQMLITYLKSVISHRLGTYHW